MTVPKSKEELICEIENNYSKLKKDLVDIPMKLTKEKRT